MPPSQSKLSGPCHDFSPLWRLCFQATTRTFKGRAGKHWEPSNKLMFLLHKTTRNKLCLIFPRLYSSCTLLLVMPFVTIFHPLSSVRGLSKQSEFSLYRVSQEECEILRESVPYVKLQRYNPKHLYPKLNGYGDNGQRKVWTSCISAYCTSPAVVHYPW